MDLEEAKLNIGKEVIYIGNDKKLIDDVFNGKKLIIAEPTKRMATNVLIEYDELCFWNIDPQHLKLKEQPMQNYKIQVTPETSEEVQKLFFGLGCEWSFSGKDILEYNKNLPHIFLLDGCLYNYTSKEKRDELEEITLPQLRDMVVLKKNDVGDATHEDNHGMLWFIGCFHYLWDLESKRWIKTKPINLRFKEIKKIENISVEVVAVDVECQEEMTWEDALRAVADGKEVVFNNGFVSSDMSSYLKGHFLNCSFSLKPQTIYIDGGDYTKEELLKIVGEME